MDCAALDYRRTINAVLYWWPTLSNIERSSIWLSLHRHERVYVLRHLRQWCGVTEVIRDVLRETVQQVQDIEHAASAHALLAELPLPVFDEDAGVWTASPDQKLFTEAAVAGVAHTTVHATGQLG